MAGLFNGNYSKGEFIPRHPEKCLNKNGKYPPNKSKITFRSSWESIFANWCDIEENVIEWGSELIEIPYFSQIDQKSHVYVTDFVFLSKNRDGTVDKWLIEVKPAIQVPRLDECGQIKYPDLGQKKKLTQKKIERWQETCNVLRKNHEKWTQARLWAKAHGYKFKVITESELGLTLEK